MKISNIQHNYNIYNSNKASNSPSFGIVQIRPPHDFTLTLDSPVTASYPRTLSKEAMALIFGHPEIINQSGFKKITYAALKDIRKAQEESDTYVFHAAEMQKDFKKEFAICPTGFYVTEDDGVTGALFKETVSRCDNPNNPDEHSDYVCYYNNSTGIPTKVMKIKNGKLEKIYFATHFAKNGKFNYVDYREDGSIKEIGIGTRRLPDGTTTKDKIYEYNKDNELVQSAMNYERHPDGKIVMTNFFRLEKPEDDEYMDKFVAKRTINTDGTVDYENVIYFDRKSFWRFFPHKSFTEQDEHILLTDETIDLP